MWTFIVDNITAICSLLLAGVTAVFTFFTKTKTTKVSAIFEGVQFVLKLIPSLIRASENANTNTSGETKKAFVMTLIEAIFAGRGLVMTDDIRATLSDHIDEIVKTSKEVNINSKGISTNGEENQRNDISGVTGLRI